MDLSSLLVQLRTDYRDIAAPVPDLYEHEPSAAEAARMIAKAHPAVIAGSFSPCKDGPESRDWGEPQTHKSIFHEDGNEASRTCSIAVTDDGLADSVRRPAEGRSTFVKPLEARMTMVDFLSQIEEEASGDVLYLQSQDGNIYRSTDGPSQSKPELAPYQRYIQSNIPWMDEAIGHPAEAVNLWIGTSRSTTSFHHDPYENIYHILSGSKTFTLISPIEGLWLRQTFHPSSTLNRDSSGRLTPRLDEPPSSVPWVESLEVPKGVQSIRINLQKGDTLYLPAEWWHRVDQEEGPGGIAVAVNYWYPAAVHSERFAYERLARRLAFESGMPVIPPADLDDESSVSDIS
ncbi:cupin-like domain-domain-containing protein [Kockovaella imperatae]|uniref:Cupin-like domain-domain-containing protein n=1 Tax=Kockovaella imperatae TaxID=4999 RepID=A0A1Y1UGX1_9TREE|nr:cupin-like domain-domain-containing protein [Kockovaella imperatae]ORX37288.1 cupin-like domain-domain-containing protein [Kockovaella imperatae]